MSHSLDPNPCCAGLTYSLTARVAMLGTQGVASVAAGAAHQVALQTWWLFSFFAAPLSMAVQSLIPRAVAAGKMVEARRTIWAQLGLSSVLNVVVTALTYTTPTLFPQTFTSDQGVIKLVQSVTLWACLAQAGVTYAQTLDGIYISRERLRHHAGNMVFSTCACYLVFAFVPGLQGAWIGLATYCVCKALFNLLALPSLVAGLKAAQ